jgi:uncharacterized RDD family membrane protein YckC
LRIEDTMSDSTQNPPPEQSGASQPPPAEPPAGEPTGQPTAQPTGQQGYAPPPPGQQYPSAPGYGYGAAPSGVGRPGELGIRFVARLIDGIIVGIVVGILNAIIVVGLFGLSGGNSYGISMGAGWAASAISSIISAALYLGYFAFMESRNGQTVGKMVFKLQTQGPDGSKPTTEESVKRNLWVALGILGVIPFLAIVGSLLELAAVIAIAVTINNSPTKQGWHDNFAGGTKVVKIG